ncbi:hypothetical protein GP163_004428 [Salmonella enterica]|nr:hypothetical protein [Salmonella enterica]
MFKIRRSPHYVLAHSCNSSKIWMVNLWTAPTTVDKFCPHDEACSKASGLTPPR